MFTYFTPNEFYSIYFESFNNSAHVGKRLCKGRLAGSLQINRNSIFTMRCSKFFGSFRRQHHWLMDVFWKVWSQEQIKSILLSAWKQNKNHATFLIINALELATFFKNTHLNELWLYHLAWRNWILVTNVIKPFSEIEHEHKYVRSRASNCLSLSSPFPPVTVRYSTLYFIEWFYISCISHPRILLIEEW